MKTFVAATYNVLAQSYAHRDRYPLCTPEALDPARRHALLLDRVVELGADLLCLQEVEPAVYDALRARLDATHHAAYGQRSGRPEGAAVFARRSHFAWRGHHVLEFAAQRPSEHDLALIATLDLDSQPLHVACTHLAWQPESTPLASHVSYHQMLELLAYRDSVAPGARWLVAGDLNALSQSAVVVAALERGLDESCRTQRPWDTCAINGRPRKIDYLLYSTGRFTPRPGVLLRLTRDSALPSLTEPSDHLPLRVEFSIA